jgi:putative ABC transport system permease protein
MRFADLIGLSLGALRQQKARTVMTTLGVVFGAFVLVVSLSLLEGVQETIQRESGRNVNMRRVEVWPMYAAKEGDLPPEQVAVKGEMSEEKRQRLHQALVEQQLRYSRAGPRVPLDRERLHALAKLDHVEAVTPLFQQFGWAMYKGQALPAGTCSAEIDNPYYRNRLVAGNFFQTPDERSVVVSEYLLYQFGITSEADVAAFVGNKLRVEIRSEPRRSGLNVYLSKASGDGLKRPEQVALEKVQSQLPAALDRLDLTPDDVAALKSAMREPPTGAAKVHDEEFTVVGVVRMATNQDRPRWDRYNTEADVLLPLQTAEDFYFACFDGPDAGVDRVYLRVDRDENVRGVVKETSAMGLQADAAIEYIDRERLIYLLVFGTMSCVAGVALLIAALGIANTMLMSVLERTREIGIFKAVGAGDFHVQAIFLIEGALIGLVGGLLGLVLAWAGSFPADAWIRSMISRDLKIELKESLFVFPLWLTGGVVLFAVIVTTLAAVYPARRAARVEPLKALRHE